MKTLIRIAIAVAAVILTAANVKAEVKDQVTFKMTSSIRLNSSEKLDSRLTYQDGHRVTSMVDLDESKPYCQILFNSDAVEAKHGFMGPMTLVSNSQDGIKVIPPFAKSGGLVSLEVSASKSEAVSDENSFTVSCNLYSTEADKASLFNYDQVAKILGKSFSVQADRLDDGNRDVAQDL